MERLSLRVGACLLFALVGAVFVHPQDSPDARGYAQAVYCEKAKEIVLFGGERGPRHGLVDTWIYRPAANSWRRIESDPSPGNGEGPMVYDSAADRVILFQTYNGFEDAPLALTWVFDPSAHTWSRLDTAKSPPKGIFGARMVYDRKSDKVILFGGYQSNQTWMLDYQSATWELVPLWPTPPSRNFHQMVYEERNGRIVMWGGESDERMWTYNPGVKKWSVLEGVSGPPLLDYATMVYLPSSNTTLLYGGADSKTEAAYGDTWLFDNARDTWRKLSVPSSPSPRAWQASAVDRATGKVYIFGGGPARDRFTNEVWVFDPRTSSWTRVGPSP